MTTHAGGPAGWAGSGPCFTPGLQLPPCNTERRCDLASLLLDSWFCVQVGQKDTLYAAQNTRGLLFFEG